MKVPLLPGARDLWLPEEAGEIVSRLREELARRPPESWWAASLSGNGPIAELEARMARWLGIPFALAVPSGTMGLWIALRAAGVGPGDEVILSPYDWGAGVAAVCALGAQPVFADIHPETFTLDPESAARRVTGRTRALIATHLFGHPADLEGLIAVARAHGLALIEDAAQALGARYRGRLVGTWGDFGVFSLGVGKAINAGEGGIVVAREEDRYLAVLQASQHPLRQRRHGLAENPFAFNGRMHPLAALLALLQFEGLEDRIARHRAVARAVSEALATLPGLRPPMEAPGCEHVFSHYSLSYQGAAWGGLPRDRAVAALQAAGIPIVEGPIRVPLPHRLGRPDPCPVAERRCAQEEVELALPRLTPEDPDFERWRTALVEAIERIHCRIVGGARGYPSTRRRLAFKAPLQ